MLDGNCTIYWAMKDSGENDVPDVGGSFLFPQDPAKTFSIYAIGECILPYAPSDFCENGAANTTFKTQQTGCICPGGHWGERCQRAHDCGHPEVSPTFMNVVGMELISHSGTTVGRTADVGCDNYHFQLNRDDGKMRCSETGSWYFTSKVPDCHRVVCNVPNVGKYPNIKQILQKKPPLVGDIIHVQCAQ